eukprot:PhF_6_TR2323/c0_g1_i3/m.4129
MDQVMAAHRIQYWWRCIQLLQRVLHKPDIILKSSTQTFCTLRREELMQLGYKPFKTYGLVLSRDISPLQNSDVIHENPYSTDYLRDHNENLFSLFRDVCVELGLPVDKLHKTAFFVNSVQCIEDVQQQYPTLQLLRTQECGPGCVFVQFGDDDGSGSVNPSLQIKNYFAHIGATCSTRQLLLLLRNQAIGTKPLESSEAMKTLNDHFQRVVPSVFRGHFTTFSRSIGVQFLKIFINEYESRDKGCCKDVHRGFEYALKFLYLLSFRRFSTHRITKLLDFLLDEVAVALHTLGAESTKENEIDLLRLCLKKQYEQRLFSSNQKDVDIDTYFSSSGMGSIHIALTAAMRVLNVNASSVHRIRPETDYLEVNEVIRQEVEGASTDHSIILYATLHPSLCETPYCNQTLWEKTREVMLARHRHPTILVLDISIEYYEKELAHMWHILSPTLQQTGSLVVLVKSLQKFSTFGCGKCMAGLVVCVAPVEARNLYTSLCEVFSCHQSLLAYGKWQEFSLLSLMLRGLPDIEIRMAPHILRNAEYLRNVVLKQDPTFPKNSFVLIPRTYRYDVQDDTCTQFKSRTRIMNVTDIIRKIQTMEERDTFGSHTTAFLPMVGFIRISVGHETIHELEEMLYGFGWIVRSGILKKVTKKRIVEHIEELVQTSSAEGGSNGIIIQCRITSMKKLLSHACTIIATC